MRCALPPAVVVLLLTASWGCAGGRDRDATADAAATASASATPRKVRVAFSPHLSWAPLMIAFAERYFSEEGLDVELVSALRTEESLVALVTGDLDVRPGPLNAGLLSAIARGAPVRITAGMLELTRGDCSYFALVVRRGIDTSGTPALRRMRTSQDGASRYVVSRMLAKRKLPISAIETVRLPEAVMAMALENGSLDAAAVSEPALSRVARAGVLWLTGEDAVPGFQWGVLAFGERLLTRERDTGMRFMRAYQRGVARYNEGKTERNVAIIAELTGASPEDVRASCWPDFRPDSRVNWASIAEFQAWARSEKLMEHFVSPEQAWDSAFVAAATPASAPPPPDPVPPAL